MLKQDKKGQTAEKKLLAQGLVRLWREFEAYCKAVDQPVDLEGFITYLEYCV